MSSGQQHDRATCWLALPYGLLWWPWLGPQGTVISAFAFLIGGLWLSPDLDTNSRPYQRWGPLRWLWWPYRKALRHRSVLSHSPVLGTLVRVGYLSGIAILLSGLAHPWGTPTSTNVLSWLQQQWSRPERLLWVALVGIEASAWLHLLQDGDPMPTWPKRQKRR